MAERLGRYELLHLLGRGGMGEVWKAIDVGLDRIVAIKRLQYASGNDVERFRREARSIGQVSHPHIAQLYEFNESPPYLVMQYVAGVPLDRYDAPLKARVEAVRDAARAVQTAHASNILHRDLKPDNILVDDAGHAFVLDFGLARPLRGESGMTITGAIMGTPPYMPPEQAEGLPLDARADVYALGATLYHVLAGAPPFQGRPNEVLRRVLRDDPPPPRKLDRTIPRDLEVIVLKAMEKEPSRRYAGVGEFADDVDRWMRGEAIFARRASPIYRLRKRVARRPLVWALGALCVALAAFGAAQVVQTLREQADRIRADRRSVELMEARLREAEMRQVVDSARARLTDVQSTLYIAGGSLKPSFDLLERIRGEMRPFDGDAAAWHCTGLSYLLEGNNEAAVSALERATALPGATGPMWAALGRARMMRAFDVWMDGTLSPEARWGFMRDSMEASQACYARAGEFAEGDEGFVLEAYRRRARGDLAALAALVAEIDARGEAFPGIEVIYFLYASQHPTSEERIRWFTRAIEARRGYFEAYLNRGAAHLDRGDAAASAADYEEALRINPRYVVAYLNRGVLHFEQNRHDLAERDFNRIIELDPDNAVAPNYIGALHQVRGDFEEALTWYDRSIELNPQYMTAYFNRGLTRAELGQVDEAIADYTKAIDIYPRYVGAWLARAELLWKRGDSEGVLRDSTAALAIEPDSAAGLIFRGLAHRQLGNRAEARADLAKVLPRLDPGSTNYEVVRGVLEELGEDDF